jgi:predicted transcriptional regulator
MTDLDPTALAEMTTEVVATYVRQNHVQPSELPNLISSVHAAVGGLGKPIEPAVSAEPLKPAVPVRKSITDDYIISLEDGRKLKSMKRYLAGLGMSPA